MTEPGDAPTDHITTLLDHLIDAVEEAKNAEWMTRRGPLHDAFDDVFHFLVERSHELSDVAGPEHAPSVSAAGRHLRNIAADAHGDPARAARLLADDLRDLAAMAAELRASRENPGTAVIAGLIDGLESRTALLEALASAADGPGLPSGP